MWRRPRHALDSLIVVERVSGREVGADCQILLAALADYPRLAVKTFLWKMNTPVNNKLGQFYSHAFNGICASECLMGFLVGDLCHLEIP